MMDDKYDYRYDKYIDDPTPYKASDGSYHATLEKAELANIAYWSKVIDFITYPSKDILLTPSQLEQIKLNPSVASLVSVIHQVMQQQLNEKNKKSMHK